MLTGSMRRLRRGPPARRPRGPAPAPIGPGFAGDFGLASANRSSRDRGPRGRKPCGKPWFGRCSVESGPTRGRSRRYLVRRLQVAVSAGRISLRQEEAGIGPSYSEAPHHLHTSTNTPQHQCWPSSNILLGSSGESGVRHPYRPLTNDAPVSKLRYRSGAVLLFLIPFGRYNRKLESNSYRPPQNCQEENLVAEKGGWWSVDVGDITSSAFERQRLNRRTTGCWKNATRITLTNSTQMPPDEELCAWA